MQSIHSVIVLLAIIAGTAQAQEELSIDDFSALTGYWVGTGFGGQSEEVWMPAVDGRLNGIFKQSMNGELQFSEYMEIVKVDDKFILRLKHFNPDFTGWEAQDDYVTFRFESITPNSINFRGLSYQFPEPDKLRIALRLQDGDGAITTEYFDLERRELK